MGDNLAEWLAYGLGPAFEDVPELGIIDRSRLASGLTRPDVLDWAKAVPETFAGIAKIDFVVMLVGSNDRQAIRLERETVDPEDERWRGLYAERVDQVMQAMKARGVPVYWVGVPPLRGQRLSTHMQLLNAIYKERAERNGVTFVDVWNGFVDEHGNYTQFGPDFAGQIRRLRTADGVHFTIAGARKLALFLEQELRRDLVGRITPALPRARSRHRLRHRQADRKPQHRERPHRERPPPPRRRARPSARFSSCMATRPCRPEPQPRRPPLPAASWRGEAAPVRRAVPPPPSWCGARPPSP